MSRSTHWSACLTSTILIAPCMVAGAADAAEKPASPAPAPATPAQEEVLVVGKKGKPSTEMKKETELLLGIAGAATDPLQAIYSLPGVTFTSDDGPGGAEPVIRGSAPQDNAYFIDLVPVSYIFHLFGNSIFDKYVISSFDLHPAAFSSKYGNATGGIIDVTLREPRNDSFTTTLHTSLLTAGGLIESGIGEHQAVYATYRRSTMDLLLDEEDFEDEDEEGFTVDELPISDDYQLKYSWQIDESNNLSFVAAGATDTVAATFAETHQEALQDPDFAGPAAIKLGFDSQGLVWNWRGDNRELTTILSHISENFGLIYGRDQHQSADTNRLLSRILYRQQLNDRHTLSAGLSLADIRYDIDFYAKFVVCGDLDPDCPSVDAQYVAYRDTLDVFAHEVFVEDRWTLGEKHALTLGLNYSSDDYLGGGRVEPRLRYDYKFNDNLASYVAAGQYSQLPQLGEMIDVLGNPDLDTVKSDHYVWGLTQGLGQGWRWGADIYYKNMQDVVISAAQDATATNYSNGAEGSAYGVEFLVRKDLTDRWYGWAALSLSKSDRTNTVTGETVKFEHDKPILFNLVGTHLIGKHWSVGFRWTYQSGGHYTPIVDLVPSTRYPDVMEPVYGELNSQKYPDYHRLDLRADYTRPTGFGYWKIYVDVLNAYNQRNISNYEYAPDGRELISPPPGYGANVPVTKETSIGIFPSIGFEFQFK
jgi:hypothetical protein